MEEHSSQRDHGHAVGAEEQILTFLLGGELYGVEILKVREILEYTGVTRVPMVPDYIRGVINLRGNVVPVVDLSSLFSRRPSTITKKSCVIILEIANRDEVTYTGILVDTVNEVVDFDAGEIGPPPGFGANIRMEFIRGMARFQNDVLIILDIDRLLTNDELAMLASIDFASLKAQATRENSADHGE